MSDIALHKSLNALVRCGYILLERKGYPWTRAIITEVGENALAKEGPCYSWVWAALRGVLVRVQPHSRCAWRIW